MVSYIISLSYHIISSYISYRIIYHIVSYIISYRITCRIIYHIVSYHIVWYISYHYRIIYRIIIYIISYLISYRIVSYRILSYRMVSYSISLSYHIILYIESRTTHRPSCLSVCGFSQSEEKIGFVLGLGRPLLLPSKLSKIRYSPVVLCATLYILERR